MIFFTTNSFILLHAVRQDVCKRYLRRGHHAEGVHDAVGVLLPDLADEQGAHAGAGASSQGVCELEALQTLAALGLFSHHVQDRIHQLCPLRVVTFGPVVSCSALTWVIKKKLINKESGIFSFLSESEQRTHVVSYWHFVPYRTVS